MKISVINGSPKMSGGISGLITNQMERHLNVSFDVYHAIKLIKQIESQTEELAKILDCEVLLIIFPLYVDSLPAPKTFNVKVFFQKCLLTTKK